MSKPTGKETTVVNIPNKSIGKELALPANSNKSTGKEPPKRANQKQRSRQKALKLLSPKKTFTESSTQTMEDCLTDVNQLTKAAHVIYAFCHTNAGEILPTRNVLDESSKILQALSQLSKSFDFFDIPETIPFTKKLREEVKSIDKCQNRCRDLISSEELHHFLPKSKQTGVSLLVHCRMLLEEFKYREKKFRQAVSVIVESEKLGPTKAHNILSKTDHRDQIQDLVDSVAENQRINNNQDKNDLHEQYRETSIRQKNQIQKLEMRIEKYEDEIEEIKQQCREKVIEIEKDVKLCNQYWEREMQTVQEKQEVHDSQRMKFMKLLDDEKQKVALKDNENKKLNKLYHDTKEKLKDSEKLNYNMSKARRKSHRNMADKACSANLKPECTNTHCQTENAVNSVPKSIKSPNNPTVTTSAAANHHESPHPKHNNHFHGPVNTIHLYNIFPDRGSNSTISGKDSAQNGRSRSSSRMLISSSSVVESLRHQQNSHYGPSVAIPHREEVDFVSRAESTMSFANPESLHEDDN